MADQQSEKQEKQKPQTIEPIGFQVISHERAWEGNFLLVDRVKVSYDLFGATTELVRGPPQSFEICERGDAAAALLLDPSKNQIILVKQFRIATSPAFQRAVNTRGRFKSEVGDHEGGWLLEAPAGTLQTKKVLRPAPNATPDGQPQTMEVEVDELPEECIRRELFYEVGYEVSNLKPITTFFSSPGGSSERIHLFYAEVLAQERRNEGGGDETEDIEVVRMDLEDFFVQLLRREFRDPKIIIAGYWLRDHLARRRIQPDKVTRTLPYLHTKTGRRIEIISGSITDVTNVDVWVNPENTHMLMDRYFGRSISAAIRWHGASKRKNKGETEDIVQEDLVANELRKELGNRTYVELMDVIETGPGALHDKGVRRIMHVAVAEGFFEQGLKTSLPTLHGCIHNVLAHIDTHNRNLLARPYTSVLIPMLGTGQGGLSVRDVAPELVRAVLAYIDKKPARRLQRICFNAYTADDITALKYAMAELCDAGILQSLAPP